VPAPPGDARVSVLRRCGPRRHLVEAWHCVSADDSGCDAPLTADLDHRRMATALRTLT